MQALRRRRSVVHVFRSISSKYILEICQLITQFAISLSVVEMYDEWNKSPIDWAEENLHFVTSSNIASWLRQLRNLRV